MAKITEDEPVLVLALAGALVSYVGSALVAHGVIGTDQMTSDEKTFVPVVAAGLVVVLGVITRHFASSAKKVKAIIDSGLHLTDADHGRFEAFLGSILQDLGPEEIATICHAFGLDISQYLPTPPVSQPVVTNIDPDAGASPAPDSPDYLSNGGMDAGAPAAPA